MLLHIVLAVQHLVLSSVCMTVMRHLRLPSLLLCDRHAYHRTPFQLAVEINCVSKIFDAVQMSIENLCGLFKVLSLLVKLQ